MGHMNTTTIFLQRELAKVENVSSLALARIRRATTIADVVQAMRIHVRVELRQVAKQTTNRLHHAAEERAKDIVRAHLATLATCATGQSFINARGPMLAQWRLLHGPLGHVAQYATRECSRLWAECLKREQRAASASISKQAKE